MAVKKRNLVQKITRLLEMFPIVYILGSRQVGKTTLCQQLCPSWHYVDLENPNDFNRIQYDPVQFFEQHPKQLIIDEAQKLPILFEVLRGVIDIFSSPLSPEAIPLGTPPLTHQHMQAVWLKGGYPEPVLSHDPTFYAPWMQNYQNTYVNRDIAALFPKLNKPVFQRFIQMLSNLSGTIINKRDLGRALETDEKTVKFYLDIVKGTYLWRYLPSFEKTLVKSIIKMPKGYLRDTGLLHFLLRIETLDQLMGHPIVGQSFEAFVIEEILKGLESTLVSNWDAYYYRTKSGLEIDCVLEGTFGILPIEIKHSSHFTRKQIRSLEQFVINNKLPVGILINQGKTAYRLTDRIFVMPVGWL